LINEDSFFSDCNRHREFHYDTEPRFGGRHDDDGSAIPSDHWRPSRRRSQKTAKALCISRFDITYSTGSLPHEKLMTCIELYGPKVIPMVRQMLG
jgi:hypothetical protein